MKIAQIAPLAERVPPKKYGGTERVVYALTEELVKRGHDVTLYATGDSLTSAKLISVYPKSLRESNIMDPYGANYWSMLNIGLSFSQQSNFDIIHDHNPYLSLPTALLTHTPVLHTLHGAFDVQNRKLFQTLNNSYNPYFVTVSKSQSKPLPNLNYAGNVYHGLEMHTYPFSKEDDGYLLFVGRISPEKGVIHAIDAAEALNMRLIIAAKLDSAEKEYFEAYIKPRLTNQIRWVGEVDQEERNTLMSNAYCLLHPVEWREPFGLVLIEAMACGCPVIAFNRGSIPEIIKHGKTGFIVEDTPEMIEYIPHVKNLSKNYTRKYVQKYFNAVRMTDDYERIYEKIISEVHVKKKMTTNNKTVEEIFIQN